MSNLKYYRFSIIITILGAICAYLVGKQNGLFVVCVLSILEVSLSFDNTIVNAIILKDMEEKWRNRFLTWGMIIAVFGMRILFPILIVCVVARIDPLSAIHMALFSPTEYVKNMEQAHVPLMGFGGAFLMMVGLTFFIDKEKDHHWLKPVEILLKYLGKIKIASISITLISLFSTAFYCVNVNERQSYVIAGVLGVAIFILIQKFGDFMKEREKKSKQSINPNIKQDLTTSVAKGGLSTFIYIEVLDSSFSFDGVIGAFAITNQLILIAIGLGVGAMFVRSMTIMLVEKGTLSKLDYLEHGAFYAILALAIIMLLKSFMEVNEIITGCIGAFFIGISFIHSLFLNGQKDKN